MAKPHRLKEIEKTHGPLNKLIPNLVNDLGSIKAAANQLGITASTICVWLRQNGYVHKSIYVKPKQKKTKKEISSDRHNFSRFSYRLSDRRQQ